MAVLSTSLSGVCPGEASDPDPYSPSMTGLCACESLSFFFSSAFFFSCPFVSTNVSSLGSCVLGNTSKIESGPMLEKEREKTPVLRDVGFRLAGRSGRLEKSLKRYKAIALGIFGRMWLESLAVDMLLFLWCSGHVS